MVGDFNKAIVGLESVAEPRIFSMERQAKDNKIIELNCLNFCCHFISELMSIFLYYFYSDILYVRILNVTNYNWSEQSYTHSSFNLRDIIGPIYSFILCCI